MVFPASLGYRKERVTKEKKKKNVLGIKCVTFSITGNIIFSKPYRRVAVKSLITTIFGKVVTS